MKKFIFSAVALMAFSFAGMANNSVEKEITCLDFTKKSSAQEVAFLGSMQYCAVLYAVEFISLTNMGISENAAGQIAYGAWQLCMDFPGVSDVIID